MITEIRKKITEIEKKIREIKARLAINALAAALLFLFTLPCFALDTPAAGQAGQVVSPAPVTTAAKVATDDPLKEKISVDYKDVDIADILRSLSYTYNLNLVTSSEVKGKVTISLKDVTITEALDAILSANGYNYSHKGNILYITPGGTEGVQVVTEPITLKYMKAVDAQNLVRKVLSSKGDIKVDEISNMLVVTDYSVNIGKLKELLKNVDQPPRQVLIEAKIVDITSKDLKNIGVTWQIDYSPGHGIFGRDTRSSEELKVTQSTPAGTTTSTGQFKLDVLTLKGLTATAQIDALVQAEKAHLLASPSIAVLNNREARIIIGEKVPYKEKTQTTTGTTETTRFIDVGTTLRVTPSINADGYITLAIHPEVSSVSALIDAGPRITTREADTVVRVKEGETIVIGGLIRQEDNRTKARIPLLGAIPYLGNLFGNSSKDQRQTELAVFITPKILLSRAEMLEANKSRYEEEAYVNIMSVADLNVQMKLYEKARNLQLGIGIESFDREAWQRKNESLSLYECIFTQFPDGPKAPEAMYRSAELYNDLGEYYLAKETCSKLAVKYKDSEFVEQAANLEKSINGRLKKEARQKAETEIAKIKTLEAEEERKKLTEDGDESVDSRLQADRLRREKERQATQGALEETLRKAREEGKLIKAYRAEELKRQQEDERRRKAAQNAEQARLRGELRRKSAEIDRRKEDLYRQTEEARVAKEELRSAAAEVRFEKEELLRAAAEARVVKEEERKRQQAQEALRKEQEKFTRQEAQRQAKERARLEKEAQARAAEKAAKIKEQQRKNAEESRRVKEALLREAENARRAKEEMRRAALEVKLAKEQMRKEALAQEAAKREEGRRLAVETEARKQEQLRLREEAAAEARLKEAARRQEQEKARLAKESRQRAAAEAAFKKEEQAKKAAEERAAKEQMRKVASAKTAAEKEEVRRAKIEAANQARLRQEEEKRRLSQAKRLREEERRRAIEMAAESARLKLEEEEVIR